ncbi:hypothetical protein DN392_26265 [Bacillus sp. BB51/4]|nr:hypothetical protein DN392_26265 [Bacillus sp. BB51/4]
MEGNVKLLGDDGMLGMEFKERTICVYNTEDDVMGALTSLKITANFILQSDGLTYFISEPTSDAQLKGMTDYLDRKGCWYEVK